MALKQGNERFVEGRPEHPSQSIEHRASLAVAQRPTVVLFGCADSRVAAEIIFDQGLGDMFVVRTAGHVIDSAVLGSIEYAVTVLNVPLIAVLGHDSCGAVQATLDALDKGQVPGVSSGTWWSGLPRRSCWAVAKASPGWTSLKPVTSSRPAPNCWRGRVR